MKVEKAMHKGAKWVAPTTKVTDLAKIMKDLDVGAVPIGEDDRLVGIVTDRDIVVRGLAKEHKGELTAADVMTHKIEFCRTNDSLEEAVRRMEEKQVRRLPVIDEQKRLVGMLSLGDVADANGDLAGKLTERVTGHHV